MKNTLKQATQKLNEINQRLEKAQKRLVNAQAEYEEAQAEEQRTIQYYAEVIDTAKQERSQLKAQISKLEIEGDIAKNAAHAKTTEAMNQVIVAKEVVGMFQTELKSVQTTLDSLDPSNDDHHDSIDSGYARKYLNSND